MLAITRAPSAPRCITLTPYGTSSVSGALRRCSARPARIAAARALRRGPRGNRGATRALYSGLYLIGGNLRASCRGVCVDSDPHDIEFAISQNKKVNAYSKKTV